MKTALTILGILVAFSGTAVFGVGLVGTSADAVACGSDKDKKDKKKQGDEDESVVACGSDKDKKDKKKQGDKDDSVLA